MLDAIRLRKEHHIVGNLVGALPEFPRQHGDYGLPVVLMAEEVRLLSKLSLVTIVDTSLNHQQPNESYFATDDCKSFYHQLQDKQYEQINSRFKENRKAEFIANLDKIVQGKLKKHKLQFDKSSPELEAFREKVHSELLATIHDVARDSNSMLTRFNIETPFAQATERSYQLTALPTIGLEALKFAVFEHFWNKGFYLTDGVKFGGHFLAYDNDPMAFHAKFIILCSPTEDSVNHFQDSLLQAYGRLARNVRKNVIIAHYQDNQQQQSGETTSTITAPTIVFKHIQWNTIELL